jgi:hypothetical protein
MTFLTHLTIVCRTNRKILKEFTINNTDMQHYMFGQFILWKVDRNSAGSRSTILVILDSEYADGPRFWDCFLHYERVAGPLIAI